MPDWPPYPSGPFTGEFVVGGFGGSPFQACKWVVNQSALVVKTLQVWYNSNNLIGIQVIFSDGSASNVFGEANSSTASITFAPGELITSFILWGNGAGSLAGRIRLQTNAGQTFDVGKQNTGTQTQYPAGLGSGTLVGMVGRSGNALDMVGPIFLNGTVTSISISNVVYNPPLTGSSGISQMTLDQVHYANPSNATQDLPWSFTNSVARTTSTTFTQGTSTTYGVDVSVGVSAELFGIGGSASTSFSWSTTGTQETSTSASSTQTLSWDISGSLAPGKGITATSFCQQGIGRANYTSTVTMKLSDGTVSTFQESGVFNNVVFTEAQVTTIPDS